MTQRDPYNIAYDVTKNSVTFRDETLYFPFPVFSLCEPLYHFRSALLDINVCAADLQTFPGKIFRSTKLQEHYILAAWVYNIIDTWIQQVEYDIHDGKKQRLFHGFLEICEQEVALIEAKEQNGTKHKGIVFKNSLVKQKTFEILKPFFNTKDQGLLKNVLDGEIVNRKLNFSGNCNQLTDVFWLLTQPGVGGITQTKSELINWMCDVFTYNGNKLEKENLDKNLLSQERKCKKPICEVEDFLQIVINRN